MEIPEIKIENNEVVLEDLEIPLKINGEVQMIKMRKLPSGERNQIRKKYTKTSYKGREPTTEIDEVGYQEETLSKAIVNAPFDSSVEGLRKISGEVLDYLFIQYVEGAEPSEKKND